MKPSIETLLANVIRTQGEFEAAKSALFLAKLEEQRKEERAALYASEIALRSCLRQNVQVDAAFEQVRAAISKAEGNA